MEAAKCGLIVGLAILCLHQHTQLGRLKRDLSTKFVYYIDRMDKLVVENDRLNKRVETLQQQIIMANLRVDTFKEYKKF